MTSITWAGPRCVQELATFLGPQNRTQGRYEYDLQTVNISTSTAQHPIFVRRKIRKWGWKIKMYADSINFDIVSSRQVANSSM